jgi:CBS-domain-containing membrane protein
LLFRKEQKMTTSERNNEDNKRTATTTASKQGGSTVGQIMTRDPKAVTPDTSIQQIAALMMECDCGSIPVIDSQTTKKVVGMVTDRDIVVRLVAKTAADLLLAVFERLRAARITAAVEAGVTPRGSSLTGPQKRAPRGGRKRRR